MKDLLRIIKALMDEFDIDEIDILCYLGIGVTRSVTHAYDRGDYKYAEKMLLISKRIDEMMEQYFRI